MIFWIEFGFRRARKKKGYTQLLSECVDKQLALAKQLALKPLELHKDFSNTPGDNAARDAADKVSQLDNNEGCLVAADPHPGSKGNTEHCKPADYRQAT